MIYSLHRFSSWNDDPCTKIIHVIVLEVSELSRSNMDLTLGPLARIGLVFFLSNLTVRFFGLFSSWCFSSFLCVLWKVELHQWVSVINFDLLKSKFGTKRLNRGNVREHLHTHRPVDSWLQISLDSTCANSHATSWFENTQNLTKCLFFVWC